MTSISGYTRCDCDWFVRATGDVCGECGHDRDQHNIGYGDESLAQEGDEPGCYLPDVVLEAIAAQDGVAAEPKSCPCPAERMSYGRLYGVDMGKGPVRTGTHPDCPEHADDQQVRTTATYEQGGGQP
jgi:hypothetical protein